VPVTGETGMNKQQKLAAGIECYELTDRFIVSASSKVVWDFFSQASNLPTITPPSLHFEIVRAPEQLQRDSILDYTIRWAGIRNKWRTLILDWQPPTKFVDLQIRGPYSLWHHEHSFETLSNGTQCSDRVIYRLPLGLIGRITHRLFVRRQLLSIFQFRRHAIAQHLRQLTQKSDVTIRQISVEQNWYDRLQQLRQR
jgi:ligand-binding SRPBCC domain-containing protein